MKKKTFIYILEVALIRNTKACALFSLNNLLLETLLKWIKKCKNIVQIFHHLNISNAKKVITSIQVFY